MGTQAFELIEFNIHLRPVFVNNPPWAIVRLDGKCKFDEKIDLPKVITFHESLYFVEHILSIERINTEPNQLLYIDKVILDGVDIRDILWIKSYNVPIYPEPWATIQKKIGNILEYKVPGETCLGHNSTWYLEFYSPTYRFIMDWMNGNYD